MIKKAATSARLMVASTLSVAVSTLPAAAQDDSPDIVSLCVAAMIAEDYANVTYGETFEGEGDSAYLILTAKREAEPESRYLCRLAEDRPELIDIPNGYKIVISERGGEQIQPYDRFDDDTLDED